MDAIFRKILLIVFCAFFVISSADTGMAEKGAGGDGINSRRAEVYKRIISPWVEKWFKEHSLEVNLWDNVRIKRKLLDKDFDNFDVVEGRDLYTVKVLYLVNILDRPSNLKVWGLKEQKIVFWLDGFEVRDFYPSEDHWKERPHYSKTTDAVTI